MVLYISKFTYEKVQNKISKKIVKISFRINNFLNSENAISIRNFILFNSSVDVYIEK